MKKKLLAILLTAALIIAALPFSTAMAASGSVITINAGTGGTPFNLSALSDGDMVYINTTDVVELTGGDNKEIWIECLVDDANLVIEDVELTSDYSLIVFSGGLNNTLELVGDNMLETTSDHPCIHVPALVISNPGDTTGGLTINDGGTSSEPGALMVTGGVGGPGIGCDSMDQGATFEITINGGDITAFGGHFAAGIGNCILDETQEPIITINGGNIMAVGGAQAAGIGGGRFSHATVTINDGTIMADGGDYAAGIGGGGYEDLGTGGSGGNGLVYIYGGTIDAIGRLGGAGIGGGYEGWGEVYIYGGTITAESTGSGAGIGGGYDRYGDVEIYGGSIDVSGGADGAGIGGGENAQGDIDIHGGTIYAVGGTNAAGIGGGGLEQGFVYIYGGDITAIGGDNGAGIGGGSDQGAVSIDDGTVTATGGEGAAGIGGGFDGGGDVYIYGGTVTATGGNYAAGIGGGDYDSNDNYGEVYIEGGTVTATGGQGDYYSDGEYYWDSGAGIGGGNYGYGYIEISNAEVTATGGGGGAGIGGGCDGYGEIYIENSKITSTGGDGGAAIGGGGYCWGMVTITSDSEITAIGGENAAGIGGGYYGGYYGIYSDIELYDSTINATGGDECVYDDSSYDLGGAGIGGGLWEDAFIYISNCYVQADGGAGAPGIGSGPDADNGDGIVEIDGGKVIANGGAYMGEDAAGIGGGYLSGIDYIVIDSTEVYAKAGSSACDDIGAGVGGSVVSVDLQDSAPVFLFNDRVCASGGTFTHGHTHVDSETVASNSAYGFTHFPDDWNGRTGYGYLVPVTITYNHNHSAPADEDTATEYVKGLIRQPSPDPSRTGYVFNGWHYNMDGTDPVYFGSTSASADDTFYADWVLMGTDSGKLSGELDLNSGGGASGCNMTLESEPITVTTDSNGDFAFGNVYYTNHTLIVRNTSGNIVKEYIISFTEGSSTSAVVNDAAGTIDITYTGDVTGVIIPLQLNAAQDDATVSGSVRFITASSSSTTVTNPQTGDSTANYLWFALALAILLGAMAAVIIRKKQNVK